MYLSHPRADGTFPTVTEYLVKWKGLPWVEATWEVADRINDNAKIEQYRAFNAPVKLTQREVDAYGGSTSAG